MKPTKKDFIDRLRKSQILAKQGYNMIGIDFSEEMLAEAKKKARIQIKNK